MNVLYILLAVCEIQHYRECLGNVYNSKHECLSIKQFIFHRCEKNSQKHIKSTTKPAHWVPHIKCGWSDSHNLLTIVMTITENVFRNLPEIFKQPFMRSQFLLKDENISDLEIALKSASTSQSTRRSQGFVRCLCKGKILKVLCEYENNV